MFRKVGSTIRVKMKGDAEAGPGDIVMTVTTAPTEAGSEGGTLGDTPPGAWGFVFNLNRAGSDNLDTPQNEAAECIGKTIVHEVAHVFGVRYAPSEAPIAIRRGVKTIDPAHTNDQTSIMFPDYYPGQIIRPEDREMFQEAFP